MQRPLIVITGAAGRIGFSAVQRFSKNYQVIGLDIIPLPKTLENIIHIKTDCSSEESVAAAFAEIKQRFGMRIASIIHLAAYYNFTGGEWSMYEKITIGGTRNLLKTAQAFEVEQFIFSSTMLVHAPCKVGETINENSPIDPKWEYPLSKVKTEELMHAEHGHIPILILRIAGVYDDYCHSIPISNQIQRIYEKQLESHVYPGHLDHGASFVHMDDLVESLWLSVEKRDKLPEDLTLLVGEEQTLSYLQLQDIIGQEIWGKPWWTLSLPKWFAKMGATVQDMLPWGKKSFIKPWMIDIADDHYVMNTMQARQQLGWQAQKNLRTTLPRMIDALKKDPKTWYKVHGLQ